MKKLTNNELADKIIKELTDEGFSFDEILEIIRLAKEKFKRLKNETN